MIDPGLLVGGGHSDSLFGELLNDELVGVDDAEYGQMRTITGEEERWATKSFENVVELRAVLTKVRKHTKATNIILSKKLSKEIRCRNKRSYPPSPSTRLYSKQRRGAERGTYRGFVHTEYHPDHVPQLMSSVLSTRPITG